MPNDPLRTRVKDHLPTVLLTLLSIVQALALELLWSHLVATEHLYAWSFVAALSWLQIGATFLGVLLVWLIYSSMVMRFRWVPSTGDSVFPFIVGVMEFLLIESLGPDGFGVWFLTLAAIFATMTWASQDTLKRARHDGDNDAYFASREPATLRDFIPSAIIVAALVLAGVVLFISNHQGWFAALAMLGATAALGVQTYMSDVFWRRSVQPEGSDGS